MVQNGDGMNDGADERMLNNEEKENLARKDEVKFISGDQQNGDAKIDIGTLDKTFTGMTKEELMKYANDPFWVRLRWIFFIIFWAIWVAMLVGAILIIINAPKCAAPTPLIWWKQGPLVKFKTLEASFKDIDQAKKVSAKGAIYELPAEETFYVMEEKVDAKIRKLIDLYKDTDINIILDITPNYVDKDFPLLKEALHNESKRDAFIWVNQPSVPNNWKSIIQGSAWDEIMPENFVLSQFGTGKYDLHMNDSTVKSILKDSLHHLVKLGVKGFRLTNAKHFILNKDLKDEVISDGQDYIHDQYGFWTHSHTTFHEGLGDVLHEYNLFVKNISNGEAFLSVSEDTIRPEVFRTKSGEFGIDIPIYGRFTHSLALPLNAEKRDLYEELKRVMDIVGNSTWLQWIYDTDNLGHIDPSAYNIFLMLLPGVPVQDANSIILANISDNSALFRQLESLRLSPSYMHGNFDLYRSGEVIAYSRFKSGNPGLFVVLNPTDSHVDANFAAVGLPEKMTFDLFSNNYNSTDATLKGKAITEAIPISPYSAAILTYVPIK